jgi:P27 family predicted phage terminase small subunit
MRGRKPKPTWQKKLEGNRGKRALNSDEPVFDAPTDTFDEVPPELEDMPGAAKEWQRTVPLLRKARAITAADRTALIALCIEWHRYLEALRQAKRTGMVVMMPSGIPMTNPYLGIATTALRACQKLWPELGLTPSSRSRIHIDPTGPSDEFSEFDQAPPPPIAPPKPVH